MMMQAKKALPNLARFAAHYALWIVLTLSQLGLALWIHQLIISASMIYAQRANNPWIPRAVDMWSIVFLGIAALVAIFASEAYLNKGLHKPGYWRRVGLVTLVEALLAAVLFGLELFL